MYRNPRLFQYLKGLWVFDKMCCVFGTFQFKIAPKILFVFNKLNTRSVAILDNTEYCSPIN